MTKEVQMRIVVILLIISFTAILVSEGIFHGLRIILGFGTLGVLYIVYSMWSENLTLKDLLK